MKFDIMIFNKDKIKFSSNENEIIKQSDLGEIIY